MKIIIIINYDVVLEKLDSTIFNHSKAPKIFTASSIITIRAKTLWLNIV